MVLTVTKANDAFNYVLGASRPSASARPIDLAETFESRWLSRQRGTTMPPSPGVKHYTLEYRYDRSANILDYSMNLEYHPLALEILRRLPDWQVNHRSRGPVISWAPLCAREQDVRIERVASWIDQVSTSTIPDSLSRTLFDMLMEKLLKHMAYDEDYFQHYIREHDTSSIGGGYKWKDLYGVSRGEINSIFEQSKDFMEHISVNPYNWINIPWNTGIRARADPYPGRGATQIDGSLERSRIVQYHPAFSIENSFIPDKPAFYKDVFEETEKILNTSAVFHYPQVEGGQIYITASDLFQGEEVFRAYDGKNWESNVGTILGSAFNPFMIYIGGIPMLPSGTFLTTILGTMANIVTNRHEDGEFIVLGDDMNKWGGGEMKTSLPWVEFQPDDTKYQSILGVSYYMNPLEPRLTGFKVTSDRADRMIPMGLRLDTPTGQTPVITRRDDKIERNIWGGLYFGQYGSSSLIETLRKKQIGKLDYISPSNILQGLTFEGTRVTDTSAWAEKLGIDRILYT